MRQKALTNAIGALSDMMHCSACSDTECGKRPI